MQENVLNQLGFMRMINAAGHYTVLGGSQPDIRVSQQMEKASQYWIDMNELQKNAGSLLRSFLGCPDGMITTGAYAALVIATRVAILEKNFAKPNVLIQSSHITKYAESFRAGGAELKEITRKSPSDSLLNFVDRDSTAAIAYVICEKEFEFSLSETVEAARQAGIPVIVDASLVDPPISGVKEVLSFAPDLVAVSGGKGFNGPNNTGILIGRSSLIATARSISFPNYGIGRAMKVSKEQIAGLMTAIEIASERNDTELVESWKKNIQVLQQKIISLPGVTTRTEFPWKLNFPQPVPRLFITIKEGKEGAAKAASIRERLKNWNPPIVTRSPSDTKVGENTIVIESRCLKPEDYDILIDALNTNLKNIV